MKTVIEMAREAKIGDSHGYIIANELAHLEAFAELVRADERDRAMRENAYVLAEREQCAVLAETPIGGEQDDITMEAKDRIAAAIRARGNT